MYDSTYSYLQKYKILTKEETHSLIKKYRETGDNEAKNTVITHNLRYVLKVASRYAKYDYTLLDDYFSEGCIGLLEAIDSFNLEYDVNFITYADYKVKRNIKAFLYSRKPSVYVPYNQVYLYYKQKREQELEENDISIQLQKKYKLNIFVDNALHTSSLNTKAFNSEGETSEVQDNIVDESQSVEDSIIRKMIRESLDKEIKKLLNEKDLILYNLYFIQNKSMKKIAEEFLCTTQNIHLKMTRIKNKIRNSLFVKDLLYT